MELVFGAVRRSHGFPRLDTESDSESKPKQEREPRLDSQPKRESEPKLEHKFEPDLDLKLNIELEANFELNCMKNLLLDLIETESKPKELMDVVLESTILIVLRQIF